MTFHLIHRRNLTARPLAMDEIKAACPAAFTDHASPETSERYGFVSTAQAIEIIADHGFQPVRAIQKPVRKVAELPFADHMLSFQAPMNIGDVEAAPEIIIYNSHNGKSALKAFAGAFRFICSNGLVAGEGFEARLRHNRLTAQGFADLIAEQAKALPDLMQRIERMKQVKISDKTQLDFIRNAVSLRWEMDPNSANSNTTEAESLRGSFATDYTLRNLNMVFRHADNGRDVWRTFNRVQEGLLRGGVAIRSYTDRQPWGKQRSAKAVQSLSESVRINRSLWDMADALA